MILDTFRKPDVIFSQWKGERFAFVTEKATVIMNKLGKIVTVWGREDYMPNVYQVLEER